MGGSDGRAVLGGVALCTSTVGLTAAAFALCRGPLLALHEQHEAGRPWSAVPLDTLVGALAALALATSVAWLAVVMLAAVVESLTGLGATAVRAVTPLVVRRLVAVSCGLALGGGALTATTSATAAEETVPHLPTDGVALPGTAVVGVVLEGLPLPDRVTGSAGPEDPPGRPTAAPPPHLVRAGDSLWSIAERLLPRTATTVEVDSAWRAVYRANRSRVGPDPDRLLPGTALRLPRQLSHPSAGDDPPDPHPPRKDAS